MTSVLSVKQLNLYVRSLIEGDPNLNYVTVSGEISNFKNHYSSGHLYFSLKDNEALIRCVMFKSSALRLKCELYDGLSVVCKGRVSLYEKDGQYQFYVEDIIPSGDGALALEFERIKNKLQKEGLFDTAHKKPIPAFPNKIAVVTSATGAALQDVINVISRRYPLAELIVCPVLVQGAEAPNDIIAMLKKIYSKNISDVIILGRGGGSIEDLWAFNNEELARTVFDSPIPIISAVGHETDFTICDFVADLRAPTPSAAAELAVPDISDIRAFVNSSFQRIKRAAEQKTENADLRLEKLKCSRFLTNPYSIIEEKSILLDKLSEKLTNYTDNALNLAENNFKVKVAKLEALSPLKVMARGFSVVSDEKGTVKSIKQLAVGKNINLSLPDGSASCRVLEIKE